MAAHPPTCDGYVVRGFEPVAEAFIENFTDRHELGAACCVFYQGIKVVDIWGGVRNKETREPWDEDTMVLIYSATKGLSALALALLHSRGQLDYEARVAAYWPEFAQNGKETITVRQLLAHQAGLFAFDEPVDRDVVADPDRLAQVMARQKPAWEPGSRQAYHALTLGFYEGELVRRIDPQRRTIGQFFQDEIARPLGIDTYIRLPETIAEHRFATLAAPPWTDRFAHMPMRALVDAFNHHSPLYRSLMVNPGTQLPHDATRVYARNLEVPAGGGVTTARGVASAYEAFVRPEGPFNLQRRTIDLLSAPAMPPAGGFHDECLRSPVQFSLGFMKSSAGFAFGSLSAFGAPGAGGAMGLADPSRELSYAYVTAQMGTHLSGDPRDIALRDAVQDAIALYHAA